MTPQTLRARAPGGEIYHFEDYLSEGAEVEIWDDPGEEAGFQGLLRLELRGGEWLLRELTAEELVARHERILAEARR